MADKHKGYSPEVASYESHSILELQGCGVTKEGVFEAAKALEPEEEGCMFV